MPDSAPLASSTSARFRCGYVAIVGWPNVGKSTLLNALLGVKLSIVSPKPQTTRESILGILNEKDLQMIFLDTPGWLKPSDTAQSFMKRAIVRSVYDDADALLWVVGPGPMTDDEKEFGALLARTKKPICVGINKVDAVKDKATIGALEEPLRAIVGTSAIVRVSAKTGTGLGDLKRHLAERLPEAPAFFPTDQVTDRWERFYVAELIREAIFQMYSQEVPHAAAVTVPEFTERGGQKDHIKAVIFVETDGQKKILIGQGGASIKQLGQRSRQEIEQMIGRPVYLELLVKVKKHWRKDAGFLKQMSDGSLY